MLRFALIGLAPALLACHVILPLERRADDSDGPLPEVSVVDAGERPLAGEAGVTDGPPLDEGASCNEDQALAPLVAECMDTACAQGGDCDGLPAYRDGYSYCSKLVYEQTFGADPGAGWELYSADATDWAWRCGRLEQNGVDNTFKWAVARESEVKLKDNGPDYLVEARFKLGAPGDASAPRWSVGIGARVTVNGNDIDYAVCELWVNPNAPRRPTDKPDVHLELLNGNATPMNGSPPPVATPGVEGKEGETYFLQMWVTQDVFQFDSNESCTAATCPGVMCVLYDDAKQLRGGYFNLNWGAQYLPTTAGVVGFRTANRAASFDYLRVFALTNP